MAGVRKLTESALPKTAVLDYDANSNLVYIGKAIIGTTKDSALWQIKKLLYDANSNLTDIQFANGSETYEYAWNDRAAYLYS